MLPQVRIAVGLALLLLGPVALAQGVPETPSPRRAPETPEPQTPPEAECTQPVESCFPDLIPSNLRAENLDERHPTVACTDFYNIGDGPTATPFRVLLTVDGVAAGEHRFTDPYRTGEGARDLCWDLILVKGRHTMVVKVDAYEEVPESNERNNVRSLVFTVDAKPEIDLELTRLSVLPPEGAPKSTQLFVINVTNRGAMRSNLTTLNLSDDHGPMATFPVPPLNPGESRTFAHPTRPDLRPVGTFVAYAVIDPEGTNREIDETNNEAYAQYVVLDHPMIDYVIRGVDISGNMTEYRGVKLTVAVDNIGDLASRGNLVYAYNESGDPIAEGRTSAALLPNGTSIVQMNLILRAGERTIRLVADPFKVVPERNESNNDYYIQLTITPPLQHIEAPNLVVERIFAMPADPRPGEAVSLGALVKNVGPRKANATVLNFTANGQAIGSANVPALPPDASFSTYVPWIVSASGLYNVTARADGTEILTELDEDDNALLREFFVTTHVEEEPEEPPEPEPEPAPPTPTTPTPTPPTPTPTPPPPALTGPRVAIGEVIITTRPVPGGAKGVISASLRNPSIQPLGLLTVSFKIDGEPLKEVLVTGIRGAATTAATSGDVDLPAGSHVVTAEVRVVGSNEPAVVREQSYQQDAGPKEGIPGPGALVAIFATLAALATRRRR